MRPAWSVIFFTTAAGAGYGLLGWLAAVLVTEQDFVAGHDNAALIALGVGLVLVCTGLLSSTFHLGRPERAWRALSQWRSSWLSREGVVAVVCFVPIGWLAWALWHDQATLAAALLVLALSIATVFCTAMIYASLRTVPAWHQPLVPVSYLVFAVATGGYLLLVISSGTGAYQTGLAQAVSATVIAAWLIKLVYWRHLDTLAGRSTTASATGLSGQVRPLDPPHTGDNYLMREMVFVVARRHGARLRSVALIAGMALPLLATLGSGRLAEPWATGALAAGLASLMLGTIIERWLFFAQARHVVGLYYGASRV